MTRFDIFLRFSVALLLTNLAACGPTPTADKAANLALDQLAIYEREVNAKIPAEEVYYDTVFANVTSRIIRIRNQEHVPALLKKARDFAKSQGSSPLANSVGSRLFGLGNSAMREWAQREKEYVDLLNDTREALAKGRKKLLFQKGKIKHLRTKLRAVSGPRSTGDMLKLLTAFAEAVGKELEETKKASSNGK